ncbi:MAG: L,D-transpeptidase [Candidatus Geothermincolia bacterium]
MGRSIRVVLAGLLAVLLIGLLVPAVLAADAPGAPTGLTVGLPTSSAGRSLKLDWRVSDPTSVTAFNVYRSTSPGSGFKKVFSDSAYTRLDTMQFIDAGLKDGATYYYRVTVVRAGKESAPSNTAKGVLAAREASSSGGAGEKRIIISTYDQRIYLLEGNVLVKSHLCSTGTDSHPTPYGVFYVENHEYCAISVKYGGVYMYYWMGFAPDIGMHALPYDPKSGTWTSADCLGHAASHGCVRQSLEDAQWAYNWAPNGTRIDVIASHFEYTPPPPPPPPITGGHGSKGISQLSTQWYFAEGCTTWNFQEYICMMNPTDKLATVNAEFMRPDGSVVGAAYTVNPFARATINIEDVSGLEDVEISAHLSSDQPIAAERSMYFHDYMGKDGGTDSAGVIAPDKEWHLAEGYTGGDFDEYVLVQNPNPTAGTVHVQYMKPDGATFDYDYPIKPTSRMSLHVDDIPELASAEVSTTVTSDQPVVVERAQYFNYSGRDDGAANAGVNAPSTTWYLAEGYTGGEFDEYVLIQNPRTSATRAKVTFMRSDGANIVKDYNLLPRSRFTIHVDEIPELVDAEVSAKVEADTPVIVERSMYYVSYGRTGGSDASGVAEPQKYWYLAEGYTGGDYDTYVLMMNPSDEAVKVDVNFLLPGGGIKAASYSIAPRSRYTIHVDSIDGLTNTEFATALTGDKPIVCERAMYFRIPR